MDYFMSQYSNISFTMTNKGVFVPISINFKFSKILGFTLHEFENFYGEKQLKMHSKYIIRIILHSIIMIVPYIKYMENELQKLSTTVKLLALVIGLRVIGCVGVLTSDLHNQIHLIEATKYLNHVDEELSKLGIPISYKNYTKLLLIGCSSVFFCVFSSRIAFVIAGESFWSIVMDFFITGYPFMILSINTFYLMFFLFVIRRRFLSLMSIMNENRKKVALENEKEFLKTLLAVTRMYKHLFNSAASINKFISLSSFICVICNLLEGMLSANLMYQGEVTYPQVYMVVSYLWLTLSTLLSPMFVEEMPGKICRMLAGIEIPDSYNEIKKVKNTFLYQALHTKIEFTVCGMFPMSMSSLPEQFSFCISLVLVMYQIAG